MDSPIISVIIPVYNAEKTIARCIDSVLEQTYQDFEILLIDDGSTDSGAEICETYADKDSRIRYIKKENGGVSTARNRGIDEAQGKYITFIDSDDWFEPVTLDRLVTTAEKHNADIVIPRTRMYFCKSDGSFDRYAYFEDDLDLIVTNQRIPEYFEILRESGALNSVCGTLYRKNCIDLHCFRFDPQIKILEDFCFNLLFFQEIDTCIHISDVLYNFYVYSYNKYAYKRAYQDYISSNVEVFRALELFNDKFELDITQNQIDFIMSYWILAIKTVLATENNHRKSKRTIMKIVSIVCEQQLYTRCTKEGLERHFQVLFQYKNYAFFLVIYMLYNIKNTALRLNRSNI